MRENADRFEGLAETYALFRPGYPQDCFADLAAACLSDRRIAVDIGAGPGTSTRGLRAALDDDWLVMAIEPGADMRRVLSRSFQDDAKVQVNNGSAEHIPLPDASAGLLVACTAFHWFDRDAFFAEAARVLAPGGVIALIRNKRRPLPVVEAFDGYIAERSVEVHDYAARERTKEPTVRDLGALEAFRAAKSRTYGWCETRDCRSLIDLYLTRSTVWALVRRIGLGQVMADLSGICAEHSCDPVEIPYETTVKWALRR
ncbi:Methyltransferase [Rhodovulum sp. P5]|uniref:class I SAM-dependent methyltransferase n=1 Tax=Rhodovulum sp. P5 TaxID=1564506 RepID=UPI0009C3AB54|nr:class I SAM-dependent methyltransferase [Rhodovulum sp. P5]ARE38797.1 Methyltransferase [Rhodovulum sp. P5]